MLHIGDILGGKAPMFDFGEIFSIGRGEVTITPEDELEISARQKACTDVLQRAITGAFGSVAKKIEEAKQEQHCAVEKIKKRRFAEAQTAQANGASENRGTSQTPASQRSNEAAARQKAATSQAAAQTAQASDAKEAVLAAARKRVAAENTTPAQC